MKLDHVGVIVKDTERSSEFYTQALGFQVVDTYRDERIKLVFLQLDEFVVELIQYVVPPAVERGKGVVDHIAFTVEDLDVALAKVKAAGGTFLFDTPREVNGQRIFFFAGPDGERLEFCEVLK